MSKFRYLKLEDGKVGVNDFFRDLISSKPVFFTSGANEGELEYLEIFSSDTQIIANRIARIDMTYDVDLNPTQEVWKLYDESDGITIIQTITFDHDWTGVDISKTTRTIT